MISNKEKLTNYLQALQKIKYPNFIKKIEAEKDQIYIRIELKNDNEFDLNNIWIFFNASGSHIAFIKQTTVKPMEYTNIISKLQAQLMLDIYKIAVKQDWLR